MNSLPTTEALQARILAHLLEHTVPFNYRWEYARNQAARLVHNLTKKSS